MNVDDETAVDRWARERGYAPSTRIADLPVADQIDFRNRFGDCMAPAWRACEHAASRSKHGSSRPR